MEVFANPRTPSKVTRHSGILMAVRLIWAAVFILTLVYAVLHLTSGAALQGVAGEWLVGLGLPAATATFSREAFFVYLVILRYVGLAVFWLVALLIFWRRSDDRIALYVAWLLLLMPISLALADGEGPWQTLIAFLGMALFLLLLFLFPDGRIIPRSPRGRIVLLTGLLATPFIALALLRTILPGYSSDEQGYRSFLLSFAVVMACGVASQLYRYRNVSNPVEHQQTKWVLFGLSAQLIWILWSLWWILFDFQPLDNINEATWALITLHINFLIPLLIPVTLGVAVLRYRLWDIDPLINRSVVYVALTSIIIMLYILIVGVLGVLFQARGSLFLALLATGTAAVIFQPLRGRLQKAVNRLMYGERDDPLQTLNRLSRQLEQADATEEILPSLVETIAAALKLPYVAIFLSGENGHGWEAAAISGQRGKRVERIPLIHQDLEIGQLEVGLRSAEENLGESDRMILASIAQLVATTIQALELNEQLQQSRRQLVTAREEERRRIRRDLHDGLGPVLASLTLQADTTLDLVHSDPDEAVEVLKKIRNKAQAAVEDIRVLVNGLRPPTLDELGLVGAIRQYIANLQPGNLVIDLDTPEYLPKLPAAVEVAAYRIVQEAVNNVIQHANSTSCTVRLALNEDLCLEIVDNGLGLPEKKTRGVGMESLNERAAELGGECRIETLRNGGSRVRVKLPINGQEI
jgi:signal transduction histidine kinase